MQREHIKAAKRRGPHRGIAVLETDKCCCNGKELAFAQANLADERTRVLGWRRHGDKWCC